MSSDPWRGRGAMPGTLHKYAYALNNGVSNIDPSGMVTLQELVTVNGTIASSLRVAHVVSSLYRFYNKLDEVLAAAEAFRMAMKAISYFSGPDFDAARKGDPNFANVLANADEAFAVLANNIGRIDREIDKKNTVLKFVQMATGQSGKSRYGGRLLIRGPTPEIAKMPLTTLTIGKIRLSKVSVDVLLEIGNRSGQGGRFLGLGHAASKSMNVGWFRMDWHRYHGAGWQDGNYHFHPNE